MNKQNIDKNSQDYWEKILAEEGLEPINDIGDNPLGDGHGDVSDEIDKMEEENIGHGPMCPINLGHSINETVIDQPNSRPTEEKIFEKLEKDIS